MQKSGDSGNMQCNNFRCNLELYLLGLLMITSLLLQPITSQLRHKDKNRILSVGAHKVGYLGGLHAQINTNILVS